MPEIGKWRVLVIDDDEDVSATIAFSLRDAGCTVQIAHGGPGGLALVQAFAPHFVFTDVRMPGMDGIQMLEHLKRDYPHIEVVVATAFAEMQPAVRALQLGARNLALAEKMPLIRAAGAEVFPWSMGGKCCGASYMIWR